MNLRARWLAVSRSGLADVQAITSSARFEQGVDKLAADLGQEIPVVRAAAVTCLEEMHASRSRPVVRCFVGFARLMTRPGYGSQVDVDPKQLERMRATCAAHPTVMLPSHRSNLDTLAMTLAADQSGLPRTHILGGINMAIWPLGPMLRRAGVIFIRRDVKDDPVYRWVLREYVSYLIDQGRSLEWYLEGGRSRTGKMLPPKLGLLRYVVDAFEAGEHGDLMAVPVSITYDQLHEVSEYSNEARGGRKQREGLRWLAEYYRGQRRDYGRIYVRYGEPVSLRDHLAPADPLAVQRLALEVSWRINQVTPVTAAAVVSMALLATRGRAITTRQMHAIVGAVAADVRARGLPTAGSFPMLDTIDGVGRVAAALSANRTIRTHTEGSEAVYAVDIGQHHAAAFYRNTVLHAFVAGAIAELALLGAQAATAERVDAFWSETARIRDLLKFEFFFADRDRFRTDVAAQMDLRLPGWQERLDVGESLVDLLDPPTAPMVLRSFLEAVAVLAHALARQSAVRDVSEDDLRPSFMGIGEQLVLQRRVICPESVSTLLYTTAYKLAEHRGLTAAGVEVIGARLTFVDEVDDLLDRISQLERSAAQWLDRVG